MEKIPSEAEKQKIIFARHIKYYVHLRYTFFENQNNNTYLVNQLQRNELHRVFHLLYPDKLNVWMYRALEREGFID